jgi:hypothetical protein
LLTQLVLCPMFTSPLDLLLIQHLLLLALGKKRSSFQELVRGLVAPCEALLLRHLLELESINHRSRVKSG